MSRLMILPMSKATLFSLPGSHPAVSVKLMLDYKGIDFKTIDLMPLMHKAVVRAAGFPGTTVPALKFNGEKLQGSVDIARALDRIVPEPPLLPADEDARKQVLMAEAFGEAELQHAVRQILWNAVRRQPKSIATFLEGSSLPLPPKTRVSVLRVFTPGQVDLLPAFERTLEVTRQRVEQMGIPAQAEVLLGHPAEKIIEVSKERRADLILMGAKGLRATLGILLGGVA